jgi:hypothetical protein
VGSCQAFNLGFVPSGVGIVPEQITVETVSDLLDRLAL